MYSASRQRSRFALIALILLLPTMMGGCPEFRNEVVNALETAARSVLDSAFDQYFDQLRSDHVL